MSWEMGFDRPVDKELLAALEGPDTVGARATLYYGMTALLNADRIHPLEVWYLDDHGRISEVERLEDVDARGEGR